MNTPAKFNPLARAALWLLAAAVLSAPLCRADDLPPQHRRMENRFLFVVETSSAMKSRTNGIAQAVIGLLKSGMQGELRPGDTIGLWTYNEQLQADFPMQIWSEKNKDDIVADVARFLSHQRYEKRERLDKVLPEIAPLIQKSERLTVIFVFDGAQPIRGTPFDADINDLHKQYGREFRGAHTPVVTLLAARGGAVFDYTINYPSSVVVPHTADPLPPPETNAPPQVTAAPAPAAPVEPKPPARRLEIVMTGTNNVVRTGAPEETAAEAAPQAARHIVMAAAPPPLPTVPASSSAVPLATEAAPVTNAPSPPPTPQPAAPLPQPAPPGAAQTAAVTAPPPAPQPAAAPPSAPVEPPPAAPKRQPGPLPAPMIVPVPAPAASIDRAALFVIAFSLLTIAIVLVIFLVRRSRGGSQPSLISQSIDRSR